jgi:hypothetical protein
VGAGLGAAQMYRDVENANGVVVLNRARLTEKHLQLIRNSLMGGSLPGTSETSPFSSWLRGRRPMTGSMRRSACSTSSTSTQGPK